MWTRSGNVSQIEKQQQQLILQLNNDHSRLKRGIYARVFMIIKGSVCMCPVKGRCLFIL